VSKSVLGQYFLLRLTGVVQRRSLTGNEVHRETHRVPLFPMRCEVGMVVQLREVQCHDVGWPLQRKGVPKAVDLKFNACFECRDYVHPQ